MVSQVAKFKQINLHSCFSLVFDHGLQFVFWLILNIPTMMIDGNVCLLEFVGEVEEDWHTNLTFNVPMLNVAFVISLLNVENIHLHIMTNFVSIDVEVM